MPKDASKPEYQGQMHILQKEMIGRYFDRLTAAAEGNGDLAVYMMISVAGRSIMLCPSIVTVLRRSRWPR